MMELGGKIDEIIAAIDSTLEFTAPNHLRAMRFHVSRFRSSISGQSVPKKYLEKTDYVNDGAKKK